MLARLVSVTAGLLVAQVVEARPLYGGFGFATEGMFIGQTAGVGGATEKTLGSGADADGIALMLGGGGKALAFGRLLLGGKGYALLGPSSSTASGSARLDGGGGGFDLGYALYNDERYLVSGYVGGGGLGLDLELENDTDSDLPFGGSDVVPSGRRARFSSGGAYVEVGMGVHQLLFPEGQGGFVLGGEIGTMVMVTQGVWTNANDQEASGVGGARTVGGFFRLNIGGGGFGDRD